MKRLCLLIFFLLITLYAFVSFDLPRAQAAPNPPQSATAQAADALIVYVSDFDLDVAYGKPRQRRATQTSSPSSSGRGMNSSSASGRNAPSTSASRRSNASSAQDDSSEETPAERANALVNAVSENLIWALNKAGYDARRLPAGTPLPQVGLRIRGVFAEADERNRARRLLVGGQPVSPSIILFVGVNNLARPEQPLYELANPPVNDPRHGPVITMTSYAPAARFELSRDPSDEELKETAAKIVAGFTALLNANALSPAR